MMIEWISIGVLSIICITLTVVLIRVKKDLIDVCDYLFHNSDPTEYIQAINDKHEQYIADVMTCLNHEHTLPMTKEDMHAPALFHYTTSAMINDTDVRRCASSIVYILDKTLEQQNVDD